MSSTTTTSTPPTGGMTYTSGRKDAVWTATTPYSTYPTFPKLDKDIETKVVIVGAGMAGISTAYELVMRGVEVCLIDAREVTAGETGRTSGHLSGFLGSRWGDIIKTHGLSNAKMIYESHHYAINRIGEIAEKHGIECDYERLPAWIMVDVPSTDPDYEKRNDLGKEPGAFEEMGVKDRVDYVENATLGPYKGALLKVEGQAQFHPIKYLHGLLNHLNQHHSHLFSCYTNTRMRSHKTTKDGMIEVETEGSLPPTPQPGSSTKGHSIRAKTLVMATNVPLNAIDLITKNHYYRTYCIATPIPSSSAPSHLLYTNSDPYIYVRTTPHPSSPDKKLLIVGGEDHKTGIQSAEDYAKKFSNLTSWTKRFFPEASSEVEYAWSGQVVEANDNIAYIGRDSILGDNIFVATGDCGNGLTHGAIASKILADEITSADKKGTGDSECEGWAEVYSPSRKPSLRTIPEVIKENITQVSKYARAVNVDVADIEEIPRCSGAVLHGGWKKLGKPVAVYKDEKGDVRSFSAICPHAGGIVAWNSVEGSWDCPVHGSRFDGGTGKCVFGPSNRGLGVEDDEAKAAVEGEVSG
ncbi:hypothetical protein TWF694_000444 [Orbilia ellipsospora]|uniref:Rieske domain-containing protein n=1 Tax=Orbilia ellipsospora TaxID=2528407 RepID=A0AAV9XNZ1_9PEZI